MGVKLAAALGGSVELVSANTASNYTATMPANTGTVVTTGSSAVVSSTMLETAVQPIGVGQTWQTVTRTTGTTYTNSTGRPIVVNLSVGSGAGAYGGILVSINGGTAFVIAQSANNSGANYGNGSLVVPAGSTYAFSVSGNSSILAAQELR